MTIKPIMLNVIMKCDVLSFKFEIFWFYTFKPILKLSKYFQFGQLLQLPQQQTSNVGSDPVERCSTATTAATTATSRTPTNLVAGHTIGLELGRSRRNSNDARCRHITKLFFFVTNATGK
jgi:hypothetical protein